jgi:hypothetical protein
MKSLLLTCLLLATLPASGFCQDFQPLFDGKTLAGWEGNLDYFRVEDGMLIAGRTDHDIPHSEFLCTTGEYDNFELRLEVKMNGRRNNGGIQIRTMRVPDHYEVSGYQCDIGEWPPENTKLVWGALYDETRRNTYLVPARDDLASFSSMTDWNDMVVRADGPNIKIWINDQLTTDFTETAHIPGSGRICAQIHGGPAAEVWHRNFVIKELD